LINEILLALWFILPAYIANSTAALFGGGTPIDLGRSFPDGRRVFGEGKTFTGLLAGIAFGTIAGNVQGYLITDGLVPGYMAGDVLAYTVAGFLLSTGALLGDLASSFVKRRLGMRRGAKFFPIDQLDFVVGAILFVGIIYVPPLTAIAILLVLTPAIHLVFNFTAHRLKVKHEPW
jgi:CDP-2,3-bis-(O-geranylgeranyl)-sn-glycerol synthase